MFGENNPFYGKKHSEETRKKIGESSLGRTHDDEFKSKQSLRNRGIKNYFYGKDRSLNNNPMFGKNIQKKRKKNRDYLRD